MYDYISLKDSAKKSEIAIIYSEPEGDIRTERLLYEKEFGKCSKHIITVYGETITENISIAEFYFRFGEICGIMAQNIPQE